MLGAIGRVIFYNGIVYPKGHERHNNIGCRQNKSYQAIIHVGDKIGIKKQRVNSAQTKAQVGAECVFNRLAFNYSHLMISDSRLVSILRLYFSSPMGCVSSVLFWYWVKYSRICCFMAGSSVLAA